MVDFRKLMSAEQRERFDWERRAYKDDIAEHRAMSAEEFVATLIHNHHNCERSRFTAGRPVYDGVREHVLIPEAIRRLGDGKLPQKCPVCKRWLDWDRALFTDEENAAFRDEQIAPATSPAADPGACLYCGDPACFEARTLPRGGS